VDEQRHEYLKVPELAEVLRIARSRVYELVGSGETRRSGLVAASGSAARNSIAGSKSSAKSVGTAGNSDYGKGMRPPR
jgi:hypothetical protein